MVADYCIHILVSCNYNIFLHNNVTYTAVVTVGLDHIEYIVNEGGNVELAAELSAPVQRVVTVMLTTSDGTALGRLLWLFLIPNNDTL